jgi:hypothetical protein
MVVNEEEFGCYWEQSFKSTHRLEGQEKAQMTQLLHLVYFYTPEENNMDSIMQ